MTAPIKTNGVHPLPDARGDIERARHIPDTPQTRSPTHTLAFADSGEVNALLLALAGAGLGIPLLLILLDESENAFADIHSAAVSVGILLPFKVERLALIIGALCTLIAWFAPLAEYQNFLLLIGSVFAPLFGVVLVDHYLPLIF